MTSYIKPLDDYVVVQTIFSEHEVRMYKCKTCKAEFAVFRYSKYRKDICYCPYCGQPANPERKRGKVERDGNSDL